MLEWYIATSGSEPIGPVSEELVIKGILAGKVPVEALVAQVGEEGWHPLVTVKAFAQAVRQASPPTPPPPPPPPPPLGHEGAWYAFGQGKIWGPFAQSELADSARKGTLPPNTLVCRVGGSTWENLEDEPIFAGIFKDPSTQILDAIPSIRPEIQKPTPMQASALMQVSEEFTGKKDRGEVGHEEEKKSDAYGLALALLPSIGGFIILLLPNTFTPFIVFFIIFASAIFVYFDRKRWGVPHVYVWATLFLWIVSMPSYLAIRSRAGAPQLVKFWVASFAFMALSLGSSSLQLDLFELKKEGAGGNLQNPNGVIFDIKIKECKAYFEHVQSCYSRDHVKIEERFFDTISTINFNGTGAKTDQEFVREKCTEAMAALEGKCPPDAPTWTRGGFVHTCNRLAPICSDR